MALPIQFPHPGAICHVMARGDDGDAMFETDDDRMSFVFRLGQVCESHGWRMLSAKDWQKHSTNHEKTRACESARPDPIYYTMKYYFLILLLWSVGSISHAENKVVLDLTDGVTWKKVFDAGFRPKHLSDGLYMCRQYDVDLSIKLSSGVLLPLGRGDVDFSVKENDLIIGLSFFGRENRSLEEARQKSEAFAKMFGENITQQAAFNTFQVKHEVDYGGRKIDPPEIEEHVDLKTTTNTAKIDDFSIIYSFRDSYLDDLPLVERLSVALKSSEAKRARRLTEKIRPPEGYEHVSMEEETGDPQEASNPNALFENPIVPNRPKNPIVPNRPEKLRPKTSDDLINTRLKKSDHFPWWLISSSIVLLVVALVAWLKLRKLKSTS